jgi:uncharacterized protein YecE (DUF72 family)
VVAGAVPLAVIRLHGQRRDLREAQHITDAERFRYLCSEDELRGWVQPVRLLTEQAEQVHVLITTTRCATPRPMAALLTVSNPT